MQSEDTTRNHIDSSQQKMQPSSSRILYDIPCKVCRDHSSGKHYGIFACDGCAGFFKRSIRRNRQYVCKAKSEHGCMVDKTHRNQCRSCRLAKCIQAGMNKDAVQHERGPRNSTLRRQMGYLFKTPDIMMSSVQHQHLHQHQSSTGAVLDLALPKSSSQTRLTVAQTATQSTIQSSSSSPPRTRAPPPPPPQPQPQPPHSVYCNSITMNKIPINLSNNLTTIPTLPILTPTMSADSVKETAARLLFMNVSWTRDLVTSAGLTIEDQLTLIEASWRELFLLGAAQMVPTLDPSALVPPGNENIPLILQVNRFRETLAGFNSMNLDYHEYACIKAIVLFKAGLDCEIVPSSRSSSGSASPNSICKLRDPAAVARLHYGAQIALGQRLNGATFGELRFGKLLMLLPTLRSVSPHAIEELFFRSTIGGIHIEKIICDMYKNTSNK